MATRNYVTAILCKIKKRARIEYFDDRSNKICEGSDVDVGTPGYGEEDQRYSTTRI